MNAPLNGEQWRYRDIAFRISDVDHLTNRLDAARSVHLEVAVEKDNGEYSTIFNGDYSLLTIDNTIRDFRREHFDRGSLQRFNGYENRIALKEAEIWQK